MKNIKCLDYNVLLSCIKPVLFKENLTTSDLRFISDYFPSADGFGYEPTEPYWNFKCSLCEHHVFDEDPPEECPGCKAKMSGVTRR